jgi:hypothetical protein
MIFFFNLKQNAAGVTGKIHRRKIEQMEIFDGRIYLKILIVANNCSPTC